MTVYWTFLLSLFLSSPWVWAAPFASHSESFDRAVDQVALEAQKEGISRLKQMVNRYHGTSTESELLLRLAEAHQQAGQLQFRIAYGNENQPRKDRSLSQFKLSLKNSIQILNRLIQEFKTFERRDLAFFMRAHAYEELELPFLAKEDYLKLVSQYPHSEKILPAYMALAEIDIQKNNYLGAIQSLRQVEKYPNTPYFPFALYKLAWSYYNLSQFDEAIKYIKQHIRYLSSDKKSDQENRKKGGGGWAAADDALLESSLSNFVQFYAEAFEHHPENYPILSALDSFRDLDPGPYLGKMNLQLAKILRAHQHERELIDWKDLLIKKESDRVETVDVIMTVFEHQMNQHQYEALVLTGESLIPLYQKKSNQAVDSESFQNARKMILEAAAKFNEMVIKNKKSSELFTVSKPLSELYSLFIQIVKKEDPRIVEVHYNLGETLFQIEEFAKATENYHWILDHWNPKSSLTLSEIELKAISSRYEFLRMRQMIPEKVTAQVLDPVSSEKARKLISGEFNEWIQWIDLFKSENQKLIPQVTGFEFNANRALYATGNIAIATQRLMAQAVANSKSEYAIPAATLVLDTAIAGQKWEDVVSLTEQLLEYSWSDEDFSKRLAAVAADATYKLLEKSYAQGEFTLVIHQGEKFSKKYPTSSRLLDVFVMIAQVEARLGNLEVAQKQFSEILKKAPNASQQSSTLFARAQIEEQLFDIDQAVLDYRSILRAEDLDSKKKEWIRKRFYFLSWLTQQKVDCSILVHDSIQEGEGGSYCFPYEGMSQLSRYVSSSRQSSGASSGFQELSEKKLERAIHQALKGDKSERAIWGSLALTQASEIELGRRLSLIREVAKNWEKLDPLLRLAILPAMLQLVPRTLHIAREELKRVVPMNKPSMKSIARRVEWMKEMERTSEVIMELPWASIKIRTLFEIARLYQDFGVTLESHTSLEDLEPKERVDYQKSIQEILKPFLARSLELAKRSFEIAIENKDPEGVITEIVTFFPALAQLKRPSQGGAGASSKNVTLWRDPSMDWVSIAEVKEPHRKIQNSSASEILKRQWAQAYQTQSFEKLVFFLQQLIEHGGLSAAEVKMLRGLTLKSLGAYAEGLKEWETGLETVLQLRSHK